VTGLLVSVRSAQEAAIALEGGADLIDVKEPLRGSLGAAEPQVWAEVLKVVDGGVPVSAALGELSVGFHPQVLERAAGLDYAKLGLSHCQSVGDWPARWLEAMSDLPPGVRPVAVAYADWRTAGSPPAEEILPIAARIGAPYLLVDTFSKSGGGLLDHLSLAEVEALGRSAKEHGMRLVLAGSLDESAMRRLAPLAAAYFAVRGAACEGERTQAIALSRVKRLATIVRTSVAHARQEVA
jgi:uncharacterized protein (UPF0264 family)